MVSFRRAFTLIEVMITLIIIGVVITPFSKIIWFGKSGVVNVRTKTIADNIAREKIEEINLMRFTKIKSDFTVFASVFRGTHHEKFIDMDENFELFNKNFSDIFTPKLKKKYPVIYDNFEKKYLEYYGRNYELYPDEYSNYRRITNVSIEKFKQNKNIIIKRILVKVFDKRDNREICQYALLKTDDGM